MVYLDNSFARFKFKVTVVGCGGTGSFLAESLCRHLPQNATLVLIDHDRVEERNLRRQNFDRGDLGRFKSQVLAERLAKRFGRPVAYSTLPVRMSRIELPGIVVSCLDNGPARKDLLDLVEGRMFKAMCSRASPFLTYEISWWVDAGNGEDYGQILIGNSWGKAFDERRCLQLPLPPLQRPELLQEAPRQRTCADMDEQGPVINQAMAVLLAEVIRRLIEGTCPWMQLYLDLKAGTLTPVMAEPEERRR